MNSFEVLCDIDRNCKLNAVNIPRQIVTERDWLGIGFRASNFNFVCPMQMVSEVLRWPMMTELPSSRSWFRGTANLRGRLLPVSDLQGLVTGVAHKEGVMSRILVVHYESDYYGFAVEQVLGIERFFSQELKSAAEIPGIDPYLRFTKNAFERNLEPWVILDFGSIIEDSEFYHILSSKMEVGT